MFLYKSWYGAISKMHLASFGDTDLRQPAPGLLDAIVSGFAEVFEQADVGAEADFFDLGGDSLAAATLMLALERVGVQLPVAALIEAPTPASLAALVASGASGKVLSRVVLKPGDAATPVFLLPGAGGSILEMVPFARQVSTSRALYGLQSLDSHGLRLPFLSIEALATFFLPLVRKMQPHGPYTLAGYSMGGVVAVELARRLQACGEPVARVIMIDTLAPLEHFPPALKVSVWVRRLKFHALRARRLRPLQACSYLVGRVRGFARDLGIDASATRKPANRVQTAEGRAFLAYRPRRFDGSIAVIQADTEVEGQGCYPDLLWRKLARDFRYARVAGDHWSMLSHSPQALAHEFAATLP